MKSQEILNRILLLKDEEFRNGLINNLLRNNIIETKYISGYSPYGPINEIYYADKETGKRLYLVKVKV